MNKILQLFDEKFMLEYFSDRLSSVYPNLQKIHSVSIKPYKKMIWDGSYHVVASFKIKFINKDESEEEALIFCSAHSHEARKRVFEVLQFLWQQGLADERLDIPQPIFYSQRFRGVFYQGLSGDNILKQVREGGEEAEEKIALAGKLFARLHNLSLKEGLNIGISHSVIETVIPGVPNILADMSLKYQGMYDKEIKRLYKDFIGKERRFYNKKNLCLIHGDAHLENIIDTGKGKVGMIDFADFCVGDFARDLGTFLQQLEYRSVSVKTGLRNFEREIKYKTIFLESYLSERRIKLKRKLKKRIKLYYDWTMLRTATYFFLKAESEPERAVHLLNKVRLSVKSKDFII